MVSCWSVKRVNGSCGTHGNVVHRKEEVREITPVSEDARPPRQRRAPPHPRPKVALRENYHRTVRVWKAGSDAVSGGGGGGEESGQMEVHTAEEGKE